MKEKIQQLIEQKISEWQEDGIYAISLYVYDEEDDPRRPVAVLGYNTERQVQECIPEASDEQEAKWNYAFWLQNEELCLGHGDTAKDVRNWIHGQELWEQEDEITEAFVRLLVMVVKGIHASGLLKDKFGKEIPILIHELEYYDMIATQNIEANGEELVKDFVLFCQQNDMPDERSKMSAIKSEVPEFESNLPSRDYEAQVQKRSTAVSQRKSGEPAKKMFFVALALIVGLIACLCFLYLHNRDTAVDQDIQGALQENNVGQAGEEKQELYVPTTAMLDAASDSYRLIYDEMDTESFRESAKAYLTDFDIHPLYAAFLRNEISVANPYAVEGAANTELSFFDDKDYEDQRLAFSKSFSLVDVNGDGNAELVFQMFDSPSELMYILGVCDNELICFDVFETHTTHIGFGVYDNGAVYYYDEGQVLYRTYTDDGKIHELIHFVVGENGRMSYYLEGNENSKFSLQSEEEYEGLISSYMGKEPEWFKCESFVDIPTN